MVTYKETLQSGCTFDTASDGAKRRQSSLYEVMTPTEARIVDEVAAKLIYDIAGLIGEAADSLADHLQVNGALFLLRMATINTSCMEDNFNAETVAAALAMGVPIGVYNGPTPGCECAVCRAARASGQQNQTRH